MSPLSERGPVEAAGLVVVGLVAVGPEAVEAASEVRASPWVVRE